MEWKASFLSCLCGSDHYETDFTNQSDFLSCLCGSDLDENAVVNGETFLSCLCGSDLSTEQSHYRNLISKLPMRQ